MTSQEIKEKFEKIHTPSTYLRVSDNHPLDLYIGLDETNNKTLRFNGQYIAQRVIGNNILQIRQVKTGKGNSILFSYSQPSSDSIFLNFCEDMVNSTMNETQDTGYTALVNRFNLWKKMFSSSHSLLGEMEIRGLIGELLFLKQFAIPHFGQHKALEGWTGPEKTHKDFSFDDEWYEIKTQQESNAPVTISSIEQLDGDSLGHLYVYQLEKMSPDFNALTLNSLVKQIGSEFKYESDSDLFFAKLYQAGYSYNEHYDNYMYALIKLFKFKVTEGFPRIMSSMLPKGVSNVQYTLSLSNLDKFKENEDNDL